MTYKDYYKILGIAKTATPEEIKRAYRKLAIKYHPDKTKGDKVAEEKFKEANEANEILSDPQKRKKYDQLGADWKHYEEAGAPPGGFDWSKYAGDRSGQARTMSQEEFNAMFNEEGADDLFETLFGLHSRERRGRRSRAIKGEDFEAETTLSFEEAYHGSTRLIKINDQTIKVTIHPGIEDQHVLRIPGKGAEGMNGGANGDLYLTVKITSHPGFRRKGNDLYCDLPVELYTAVLGGKTKIKTLKGTVKIDIPKETQNGKMLRLLGLGMPIYDKKNEFGNLYVKVVIQLPDHFSKEEIDLFKKLAAIEKTSHSAAHI